MQGVGTQEIKYCMIKGYCKSSTLFSIRRSEMSVYFFTPMSRSKGKKTLYLVALVTRFLTCKGFIPEPSKTAFYYVTNP